MTIAQSLQSIADLKVAISAAEQAITDFKNAFTAAGKALPKVASAFEALKSFSKVAGKFLGPISFALDLHTMSNWAKDTDDLADKYREMDNAAEEFKAALDALPADGKREFHDPPYSLPVEVDSEPSGIKIQWFEGTPHWITKQSVIGGNTVDGDFSHLVTINRIYQLWNATIPIPGSDDMGQWNGTFDFWGNLGSSSATLRGVNSDGSLTGFANVSFESLGFTQEKALEIARIKERALHHEWDLLAERIKQINALISAGFFVGGLVALAIGASVLTGGVLVLIGAIIGVIGLVAEWFLSTRKTPLELAIIANFPSAASAGGG